MAFVDITPYLAELDEAVAHLVEPPLTVFEAFDVVKVAGDTLKAAVPLQTSEDYQAALLQAWFYLDGKHALVARIDEAIKAGIFEAFDGLLIRKLVEKIAIPQLAGVLASQVG